MGWIIIIRIYNIYNRIITVFWKKMNTNWFLILLSVIKWQRDWISIVFYHPIHYMRVTPYTCIIPTIDDIMYLQSYTQIICLSYYLLNLIKPIQLSVIIRIIIVEYWIFMSFILPPLSTHTYFVEIDARFTPTCNITSIILRCCCKNILEEFPALPLGI